MKSNWRFGAVLRSDNLPRQNVIRNEIQLLVEGNDQRNFFTAMIDHLQLENIQVQNFGGVRELRNFLSDLAKSEEFPDIVRSLGIVRDAETSAPSAFQSVQDSLRNVGLPIPARPAESVGDSPTVSVLILPDDKTPGMLESLLCQTFEGTPVDDCIESFFECVQTATNVELRRPEKARAHAYLATQRDPHVSVGVAAMSDHGYWNMDHPALNVVRQFLCSL